MVAGEGSASSGNEKATAETCSNAASDVTAFPPLPQSSVAYLLSRIEHLRNASAVALWLPRKNVVDSCGGGEATHHPRQNMLRRRKVHKRTG